MRRRRRVLEDGRLRGNGPAKQRGRRELSAVYRRRRRSRRRILRAQGSAAVRRAHHASLRRWSLSGLHGHRDPLGVRPRLVGVQERADAIRVRVVRPGSLVFPHRTVRRHTSTGTTRKTQVQAEHTSARAQPRRTRRPMTSTEGVWIRAKSPFASILRLNSRLPQTTRSRYHFLSSSSFTWAAVCACVRGDGRSHEPCSSANRPVPRSMRPWSVAWSRLEDETVECQDEALFNLSKRRGLFAPRQSERLKRILAVHGDEMSAAPPCLYSRSCTGRVASRRHQSARTCSAGLLPPPPWPRCARREYSLNQDAYCRLLARQTSR